MTNQKHLKARVRMRMSQTGERYAAARAHVVAASGSGEVGAPAAATAATGPAAHHLAGIHPETTAIRILARAAGREISEEMALVAGGGIGAGVFAFQYPGFSSLYLAGRHRFDGNIEFVRGALERLGLTPSVSETGGAATARRNLAAALDNGPVIAWLDFAELGTRGLPAEYAGGGYHVATAYATDPDDGSVSYGDLRPTPETIDGERFGRARARIARDRNRLVGVAAEAGLLDLSAAIIGGIAATVAGFDNPRSGSFGLAAFATLADRMTARRGREAWSTVFPRGGRLWSGLRSLYEFVERYGTGGGLMRPMFGRGLAEAAGLTGDRRLTAVAERYADLGGRWSSLAAAALPGEVPNLRDTKALVDARDERYRAGAGPDELRDLWRRQDELGTAAETNFPLSEAATVELLGDLSARLRAIAAAEQEALAALRVVVGGS